MRGAKVVTVGAFGLALVGPAVEFVEGTHLPCLIQLELCAAASELPIHVHGIDIATP